MVEKHLDTSGTVCPMPAFKTRKEAIAMAPGDTLVITGNFLPAVENITRVAEQNGCVVGTTVIDGDRFTITVKKA